MPDPVTGTAAEVPLGRPEHLGATSSSSPDPSAGPTPDATSADPGDAEQPPRRSLTERWQAVPLRWQLVVGLLVIVAVALVGAGGATYVVLKRSLVSQVDDSLTSVRQQSMGPGGNLSAAIATWIGNGAEVYFVAPDRDAYVLDVGAGDRPGGFGIAFSPVSHTDGAALATVPAGDEPVTVTLSSGEGRAIATTGTARLDAEPVVGTVVAVQPLSRVDDVVQRYVGITVLVTSLALLLVAVAGSVFVRRSLRPLQRVAETAGQVATLPLDRGDVAIPARVPTAPPTTEVGQVGSAVNAMLDHVEESLRTRQDTEDSLRRFVSDAGHELRTPLAAVRGYAELVRRAGAAHPDQALASAGRIEAAADRMGVLVEDLLLLASLEEGRPLERSSVDLGALADETVADFTATHASHRFELGPVGPDVTVLGDGERLRQVLTNLLGNAAAYTPSGSTVTTSVLRSGDTVELQVHDDGPGFPPELLPRATERFARGDASRSRATGGSGLGLAIARAIVETHGGRLTVANDGGAVVSAYLPA